MAFGKIYYLKIYFFKTLFRLHIVPEQVSTMAYLLGISVFGNSWTLETLDVNNRIMLSISYKMPSICPLFLKIMPSILPSCSQLLPSMNHCCNGSIFLPVPVPVLELTQIIWQFRVRFQN